MVTILTFSRMDLEEDYCCCVYSGLFWCLMQVFESGSKLDKGEFFDGKMFSRRAVWQVLNGATQALYD